jgi:signal transduction histidine kinase
VFLALASALQNFVGLQPLVRVRKAVSAVRHGTSSSIDDHGPVEVRPLIAEINTLLLAERSAVERARARASDLASGLKTPVTILSQIGETVEKSGDPEQANRIRDQVEAIRSRTYRQLALARSSVSGAMQLDAATLTAKLADVVASVAATRKVRLENRIEAGTMIRADATDYAEALGNLIDNAIAHAKSKVVISAAAYGKFVRIKVANDGSGIDAKDRVTALARGQRLDESGNGFGLGLAITTDIMRAYGGSISLDTSPMDGLAVHLDWPKNQV